MHKFITQPELEEKKAKDQINALHKQLLELGRLEDLKRAVEDKEYQKKLMKEFGIS